MMYYIISYKPKDDTSRTLINHTLFGRLSYKNRRGKKIAYYLRGLLDDIEFKKLGASKILVPETLFEKIDKDYLNVFGDIKIETSELVEDKDFIKAREFWKDRAENRGYLFHICRK